MNSFSTLNTQITKQYYQRNRLGKHSHRYQRKDFIQTIPIIILNIYVVVFPWIWHQKMMYFSPLHSFSSHSKKLIGSTFNTLQIRSSSSALNSLLLPLSFKLAYSAGYLIPLFLDKSERFTDILSMYSATFSVTPNFTHLHLTCLLHPSSSLTGTPIRSEIVLSPCV